MKLKVPLDSKMEIDICLSVLVRTEACTLGVFLVTTANTILPVDSDHSVNTYS